VCVPPIRSVENRQQLARAGTCWPNKHGGLTQEGLAVGPSADGGLRLPRCFYSDIDAVWLSLAVLQIAGLFFVLFTRLCNVSVTDLMWGVSIEHVSKDAPVFSLTLLFLVDTFGTILCWHEIHKEGDIYIYIYNISIRATRSQAVFEALF